MIHTERLTDLEYSYLARDLVCEHTVASGVSDMTSSQCAARMAGAPVTLSAAPQLEHWGVRRMHRGGIAAHVSGTFPSEPAFHTVFNVSVAALDDLFARQLARLRV